MTLYRIASRVVRLQERFKPEHISGVGDKAAFREVSTGWWLTLEGHVSFCLGTEKPPFAEGDPVRLTLEKVP